MSRFVQASFCILAISSPFIGSSPSQQIAETQRSSLADKVATVPWVKGADSLSKLSLEGVQAKFDPGLIQSINESSDFLKEKWGTDSTQTPIPRAYLESLELDSEQLSRAAQASKNEKVSREQLNAMLKDVAEDLAIKASHCKSSSTGWASLITVEIRTLKDQRPVAGLQVWYVPKGWADMPDRWTRCSKLSTPTSAGSLPPGLYMMRVEKGDPVPIRVGGDGKDTQSVELLAP
jgi:hypothetical protein